MVRPVARPNTEDLSPAAQQSLANANRKAHMDQVARHYKALGMDNPHAKDHAMMRSAMDSGGRSYTGIRDMFDGGGPGRSGSRFFMRDTGAMDANKDNYISEAEALAFQNKDKDAYNKAVGGIGAISNFSGARPRGSYAQERALGPAGTNIGTSGIANYITGGGTIGALFGGRDKPPNTLQRALPQMDANQRFTFENLKASGMSEADAIKFLGSNYSPPSTYSGDELDIPMNMNMGGIMQLSSFGRSV
jgi:hypothetical protein